MPFSTDVNLPRSHKARFPSKCIKCGNDPASGTIRLGTRTIGWWSWILWMGGKRFTTTVPTCSGCGWRIRIQRVGGLALVLTTAIACLLILWPLLEDSLPRSLRKWGAMGLMLACVSPYLLWETIFPPCIDITAFSKSVDYEFRDSAYAKEFAKLNADADWVKLD